MNYLLFITLITSSVLFQTHDKKMTGKYKMEYDYSYGLLNGTINFDDDTYVRVQLNGKKINGDVDYKQYFIFLNDKKSNLQVKFPRREMGNDTIFFRTIDLKDKSDDKQELTIYGGKLIKLK